MSTEEHAARERPGRPRRSHPAMKITSVEAFVCDGGLREFGFVKVSTDEGVTGWAETYDWHTSASLAAALEVMGRGLVGQDPRRIEALNERICTADAPASRSG